MVRKATRIPLPLDWPRCVKAGVIHVYSLAQAALTTTRVPAKRRSIVARLRAQVEEKVRRDVTPEGGAESGRSPYVENVYKLPWTS